MKCSNKLELLWLCFKGFGEKWNQIHIRKYSLQCTFLRDNNEDVRNNEDVQNITNFHIFQRTLRRHTACMVSSILSWSPTRWSLYWYFDLCFDRKKSNPDNREIQCYAMHSMHISIFSISKIRRQKFDFLRGSHISLQQLKMKYHR